MADDCSDTAHDSDALLSRDEVLAQEDARLAAYACGGSSSRGRRIEEPADPLRTDFQRDHVKREK